MNTKSKKLIELFNQSNNLIVITNYPPRGEGIHTAKIGGVSGYSKNTLIPLSQEYAVEGRKIIILAEVLDRPMMYEEDNMLIVRCWKRNSLSLYTNILKQIMVFQNIRTVLIEFEFASFGDFKVTSLFPFLLIALKLSGKRISIALHQVVTDIWSLSGHLGIRFGSRKHNLFSKILPLFYFVVTHIANQVIVLENEMKNRLRKLAPDNIRVIPHGVESIVHSPSKAMARRKLHLPPNDFIVLSFGFITWYKGTDILVRAFSKKNRINHKSTRLIVAGGPSTSQQHKPHYQRYYQSVLETANHVQNIKITGFIPANLVQYYFAAADCVVMPYRSVMSSSGPLSLSLAYRKPIFLSPTMADYFHSEDIQKALKETHLSKQSLIIDTDPQHLLISLQKHVRRSKMTKIITFVTTLGQLRAYSRVAHMYKKSLDQLYAPIENLKLSFQAQRV